MPNNEKVKKIIKRVARFVVVAGINGVWWLRRKLASPVEPELVSELAGRGVEGVRCGANITGYACPPGYPYLGEESTLVGGEIGSGETKQLQPWEELEISAEIYLAQH